MAKNRYTRALKVLKDSQVDEKLQMLESLPTNNTTGLYVVEPAIVNTVTIPGEVDREADFTQDGDGGGDYDGTDTTGLFLTDGTILTIEPPGDTSYILGPMASMWYAWGNFTQIGYIRQSDRKMVNLARITGELGSWDGSSNFTSYGQLTLEQAVWFQGTPKLNGADNDTPNYRAFYPGPPSNVADEHGRYLCVITGTPKSTSREEEQRTPDVMGDAESQGYPWEKKKLDDEDKNYEMLQMALNAAMLGLDIVAVLALLFPEPASSAAGAAHLASKLRYVAKLRRLRGALNPFGQRAVRSGAAGRVRRTVYSGRPYRGKRGFGKTTYGTTDPKTAATYSNPGPLKGTPGTGGRVNPKGTVDQGTLPQRYIDKYGSRSVLGQKQIKLGQKAARRTFGEMYGYINNYLLEAAPTGSGPAGGTEIADMYVDEVSKTSSPEDLENASNEANNIAREGNQGLSDSELAKIDKDADREARRQTRINMSRPESMSSDQLSNSITLMYEADPGRFEELSIKYDNLIDGKALDAAYTEYLERYEYINSWENYYAISPKFERYYKDAERLYDTYVSKIYFGRDGNGNPKFTVGGESIGGTIYREKLDEWSDLFKKTWDTFNDVVVPKKAEQFEAAYEKYSKASDAAFRQHLIAIIKDWNNQDQGVLDDPYSINDYINQLGGLQNMSEADKKRLRKYLSKMGISYGNIASVDAMNLGLDAATALIGLGVAGIVGLYNISYDAATNLINAIERSDPYGVDQAGPTTTGDNPRAKDLTPEQQAEVEAAGNELRDAQRALNDLPADATDAQRDMAQERLDRAQKNRQRIRRKHREENRNRRENYEPKFLKNRSRQPLEESITPKQKRILREIKKPFEIKEAPTKFKVKPTGRNNKVVGAGLMKPIEDPKAFKPDPAIWKAGHKKYNEVSSQDKKNHVLELVGASDHHWSTLIERSDRERQEKVNEAMAQEFDREMEKLYEKYQKKETKVDKVIQSIKTTSLDKSKIKPVHPDEPPSERVNGYHPKYGQKYKHDKLDPHSAEFMPDTGNPVIDANIRKSTDQERKNRKVRILRKPSGMS